MTLVDSLRHTLAIKDSIIHLVATRPLTVNVPPQHITTSTSRDLVDYLINPAIAIVAAILGAIIGGWQARRGGLEAIRAEFELNRNDAVERLRRRIDRNLIRTMSVSIEARNHDAREPFPTTSVSELKMIWEGYDRLSDHLGYLGPRQLQDLVDLFFAKVRKAADGMAALETKEDVLGLEQTRDPESAMAGVERGRLVGERRALAAELSALEIEAKKLWLEIYWLVAPDGAREAAEAQLARELMERARGFDEPSATPTAGPPVP